MNLNSTQIRKKSNKVGCLFYFFAFLIIGTFSFIVYKDISLPESFMRVIGIAAGLVVFFYSITKPIVSFLILVAYSPFARILVGNFGTMTTGFNITNILMSMVILGWFFNASSSRSKLFQKSSLNFFICAFIVWGIISLISSSYSYGAVYFEYFIIPLKRWLTPMILYFITVNLVKDKASLKKTVVIMMIAVAIVGLMSISDYIGLGVSDSLEESRVGGVFEQPNMLGGFFVYNMFLYIGFLFVYFSNFKYWLMLIPFLICFRGIQVTFSRGAYIACAFGALAAIFFKNKILFAVMVFLLIFMVSNPHFLPAGMRSRMEETFSNNMVVSTNIEDVKDTSALNRIVIWKGAVEMIKDHPFFGVGYGLFSSRISSYAPIGEMDAHNTYLILAAEMGILALVIFLIIILIMIKNSYWLYKKSKDKFIKAFALGMLGGIFGLLMVNMFGSRMNAEEVSAYFWVYAGLIMAAVRLEKKEAKA